MNNAVKHILIAYAVVATMIIAAHSVWAKKDTGIPNKPDYSLVNVDSLIVHDAKGNKYKLEQRKGHYHFVHKIK